MPKYEIHAGSQVFTRPLHGATEDAALHELAAAGERFFKAGNSTYPVPGSVPPTSVDMSRGQLVTAYKVEVRVSSVPTRQQIHNGGGHLAIAEALIRGFKAALVGRSSLIEVNGRQAQVQVAAKGAWQIADVDRYTSDTIEFLVLVDITDGRREFYICPGDALRSDVGKRYDQFLSRQGGIRPRNPDSRHATVSPEQVRNWHDNWELFT